MDNIYTKRLILLPITLEITACLLDKNTHALERLGYHTEGSWPTKDTMDILPSICETLREAQPSGFETWLIIRKNNNKIIGDIGFHGKPDDKGEVEIGYAIVAAERGQGFGYEALEAIISWTATEQSVKTLKAACLINNTISAHLLQKAGMWEVNQDNELIYWQREIKRHGYT